MFSHDVAFDSLEEFREAIEAFLFCIENGLPTVAQQEPAERVLFCYCDMVLARMFAATFFPCTRLASIVG
jgi:hypothetical protein